MPRKARIDAPGALHHIICRGIEKRPIFRDKIDRRNFIKRLGTILSETGTPCFAWTLMPNHVHLLLRTGQTPLANVMRRLLTGYAQQFNRRHRRHGHLFQNRYKSFLCEEEPYFLELVRYIHLNPLRGGLVKDLKELGGFVFCGHGTILGNYSQSWQDVDYVLKCFSSRIGPARRAYNAFVAKGLKLGKRPELVGGGLVRSSGGWSAIKAMGRKDERLMGDERILGSSEFVQNILKQAREDFERKTLVHLKGPDLDQLISQVANYFDIAEDQIKSPSKQPVVTRARCVVCHLAVCKLLLPGAEVSRHLNLSPSTISKAAIRGRSDPKLKEIEKLIFA